MRRTALYSSSVRVPRRDGAGTGSTPSEPPKPSRIKLFAQRHEKPLWLASGVGAALLAFGIFAYFNPGPRDLTQNDIDAAVLHTLEKQPAEPSRAAVAYSVIAPSVVLVRRLGEEGKEEGKDGDKAKDKGDAKPDRRAERRAERERMRPPLPKPESGDKDKEQQNAENKGDDDKSGDYELQGIGTGVVFSEDGLIFTCLHVMAGAERIGVTFGDGTESEVEIVNVQPENDLAVLKPKTVPDDLKPATLRSTKGLNVGDEVVAVGFPFGIGPTATAGVVSGLRREHFSQEGQRNLIDLIQFDAAANPGNSGGPLVTRDGDVVGIVTSIMNPISEGFFVGIAFAVPIENAASAAGMSPF
jgi:S1-C subfamily serine protease